MLNKSLSSNFGLLILIFLIFLPFYPVKTIEGKLQNINADSSNIIITEIMANPDDVSDSMGEYFEVYNKGLTPINLNGWNISDLGSNYFVISEDLWVMVAEYVVLGISSDLGAFINVDYVYSNFYLSQKQYILQLAT